MKYFIKILLFSVIFVAVYISVLIISTKLHINGETLFKRMTNYNNCVGGWGQTLRRFREIDSVKNNINIDILFLGSSHTYRGFDPRIFEKYGYTSFNMGSTGQTPLNTYYLLREYFERLRPKLVIFEVYPVLFSLDGIESYYDLVTNIPLNSELAEMAFALKSPQAIHLLIINGLRQFRNPLNIEKQKEISDESYISGGYCESKHIINKYEFTKLKNSQVLISEYQMQYLAKIVKFIKNNQSNVILVTQPLPIEYIKTINNYKEVTSSIRAIANDMNLLYLDYNDTVSFDSKIDFYDQDHLTSIGVKKFNQLLINDLSKRKILF